MRSLALGCLLGAVVLAAPVPAAGKPLQHVVAPGETLTAIARQYSTSVAALRRANDLRKGQILRVGQRLAIPAEDDPDGSRTARERRELEQEARAAAAEAREAPGSSQLGTLAVPGAPPAYYYEPTGPGRKGLRPVLVYLHGRGGRPASDCQRWAPVARRFGWLLCPSGQEDRGGGQRGWNNDWYTGQRIVLASLAALREKFGGRVQLRGNTLIGFSEGAYVAMNVGVREPATFNRWLILAADADYWGGPGTEALATARSELRAVYLVTGERDGVAESTRLVRARLERVGVPVRASMPKDLGHEVALEQRAAMYRAALDWLARGDPRPARRARKTHAAAR